MTIATNRADRVLFSNISWQQFENLLKDLGEHRAARVAYDNGTMEIITPLPEHEYYKETISDSVKDIGEELDLNYESLGSTTWRTESRMAGVEADNCFYFQNRVLATG
jgi:Uma2 family endonuclease